MTANAMHVLVGRLNTGWIVCEREADPVNRARLEDHWLELLHEYERLCDQAIAAHDLIVVPERLGVAA
jgi:hypothetical protein